MVLLQFTKKTGPSDIKILDMIYYTDFLESVLQMMEKIHKYIYVWIKNKFIARKQNTVHCS